MELIIENNNSISTYQGSGSLKSSPRGYLVYKSNISIACNHPQVKFGVRQTLRVEHIPFAKPMYNEIIKCTVTRSFLTATCYHNWQKQMGIWGQQCIWILVWWNMWVYEVPWRTAWNDLHFKWLVITVQCMCAIWKGSLPHCTDRRWQNHVLHVSPDSENWKDRLDNLPIAQYDGRLGGYHVWCWNRGSGYAQRDLITRSDTCWQSCCRQIRIRFVGQELVDIQSMLFKKMTPDSIFAEPLIFIAIDETHFC